MNLIIILLLVAGLVCFIIAAANKFGAKVNLIALGLACWIATLILPHIGAK